MHFKQPHHMVFSPMPTRHIERDFLQRKTATVQAILERRFWRKQKHGYAFLKEHCIDREYGGIYWSLNYDGTPFDTTKHTYNQAFGIYALSSYYETSHDEEALALAKRLFSLIEEKCTDGIGYLEALPESFIRNPTRSCRRTACLRIRR